MQRNGNHLTGDLVQVDNFTKGWTEVEMSPIEIEYRNADIVEIASKLSGCFADLTDDIDACIRFQYEEDAEQFEQEYNAWTQPA